MATYDGEVIINTEIEDGDYQRTLDGYKMGTQELSAHVQNMVDKLENLTETQKSQMDGLVRKFNEQNDAYATQEAKIESLKQKWYELYNLEKQIANVEKEIRIAKEQLDSGTLDVNEYMAVLDKLEQLEKEYEDLKQKKKDAFGRTDTESLGAQIDKETGKLDSMGDKLEDTYGKINTKIKEYNNKTDGGAKKTGKLSTVMSGLGDRVKTLALSGLEALKNKLTGVADRIKNFGARAKSGFGTLLKYAIGLGSIVMVARQLRKALQEGINAFIQAEKEGMEAFKNADAETYKSVTNIQYAINNLKASLGSAFAPLINAIAPAVTYIIDMVTKAMHYVGMFISALTGKKTYKMATAINNTAKATDKNTNATKKNTKATKKNTQAKKKQNKELKRYLSGLDEMARWEDKNKKSNSPKSNNPTSRTPSSSGTGNDNKGLQVRLDEVKIPKSIRKLAETIKEYIRQNDWRGLGTFIGTKIETALDNIPWGEIQQRSGSFARNFANFLNGIFGNEGLAWSVGRTVGEALNTILNIGYNFLKTFNFYKFGKFIGKALKTSIKTFDWKKLGTTVGKSLNAVKDTVNGFWDGYDAGDFASGLADSINTAIDEYDGEGMGTSIGRTLQGVVAEAITFITDFDWADAVDKVIDTVEGFFAGFFNPNSKEAKKVFNKFQEFINGTGKNGNVWEGLLGDPFDETTPFQKGWHAFLQAVGLETVTVSGDTRKKVKKNTEGTAKESKSAFKDVPIVIGGLFDDTWRKIKSAFSSVGSFFAGVWNNIKKAFTSVKTWFGNLFTGAWNKIKGAFANVKSFFSGIWGKIKDAFSNAKTWFSRLFSTIWGKIKAPFSSVGKWFKEHVLDKITGVFTGKNGIGAKLKSVLEGAVRVIEKPINAIIDGLNWLINKFKGGINKIIGGYNQIAKYVPALKTWKKLDTKSNTLKHWTPALAKGGVIPPNKEFLALMGDQKHGTNIETPESLLRQIVSEESGKGMYEFIAQINRKTLFDEIISEAKLRKKQSGQNAFANI